MNVGVCRLVLRLPANHSLKEKRGVVKSIVARVQNRFNVSVAEVDGHDLWQLATIGICCVSTSDRHAHDLLSNVVNFVRQERPDLEIIDYEIELLHAL